MTRAYRFAVLAFIFAFLYALIYLSIIPIPFISKRVTDELVPIVCFQ